MTLEQAIEQIHALRNTIVNTCPPSERRSRIIYHLEQAIKYDPIASPKTITLAEFERVVSLLLLMKKSLILKRSAKDELINCTIGNNAVDVFSFMESTPVRSAIIAELLSSIEQSCEEVVQLLGSFPQIRDD